MSTEADEEHIRDAMQRPKQTTVGDTSNTQHSLTEQLDAQERLAANKALKRPGSGIAFGKLKFPGAS